MSEEKTNGLTTLFDRAASLGPVEIIGIGTNERPVDVASVPKGRDLISLKKHLDEYLPVPERRVGVATLQDLASFVAWINRHKDTDSVLRCALDPKAPTLHAVIDYHQQGPAVAPGPDGRARWCRFGATYALPLDKRWQAWTGISGKALSQMEFAAFLEDHVLDLISPRTSADVEGSLIDNAPPEVQRFLSLHGGRCGEPADVVALSKGLEVYADSKVSEKVNLQTGETQFTFEEKHRGAPDAVVVPQIFLIAIPVFNLSDAFYRVPVRLRYRVVENKLLWFPTLWQAEEVFDKAVRDAAEVAQDKTDLPLFYGTTL